MEVWKAYFDQNGRTVVQIIEAETIEKAFDKAERIARKNGVELIEVSDK